MQGSRRVCQRGRSRWRRPPPLLPADSPLAAGSRSTDGAGAAPIGGTVVPDHDDLRAAEAPAPGSAIVARGRDTRAALRAGEAPTPVSVAAARGAGAVLRLNTRVLSSQDDAMVKGSSRNPATYAWQTVSTSLLIHCSWMIDAPWYSKRSTVSCAAHRQINSLVSKPAYRLFAARGAGFQWTPSSGRAGWSARAQARRPPASH